VRWTSVIKGEIETISRPYFDTGEDPPGGKKKKAQGGGGYQNQYGKTGTSLASFRDHYNGMSLNQIVTGEDSYLGYKFPNFIESPYQFVNLSNGRQVDMIHFLVVGPRGHFMGIINEIKQIFTSPVSAFYPQDIYSNILGVNFFNSYGPLLQQNPDKISTYIYWFLSNPSNINFTPINFGWDIGPKY
jgi:hypothetical protein